MPDFIFNPSTLKNLAITQIQKMRNALPVIKLHSVYSNKVAAGDWSLHYTNFNLLNPLTNLMSLAKTLLGTAFKINSDQSSLLKTLIFALQFTEASAESNITLADAKGGIYSLTLKEGVTDGMVELLEQGKCDATLLLNSTISNISRLIGSYCTPQFADVRGHPRIFLYALNDTIPDDLFWTCFNSTLKKVCNQNDDSKMLKSLLFGFSLAIFLLGSVALYVLYPRPQPITVTPPSTGERTQAIINDTTKPPFSTMFTQLQNECLALCPTLTDTTQQNSLKELDDLIDFTNQLAKTLTDPITNKIIDHPVTLNGVAHNLKTVLANPPPQAMGKKLNITRTLNDQMEWNLKFCKQTLNEIRNKAITITAPDESSHLPARKLKMQ